MKKIPCVIFDYSDACAGLLNFWLDKFSNYNNKFYISLKKIPKIDIDYEYSIRPTNFVTFPLNNKLDNKSVYVSKNFIKVLKDHKINHVFICNSNMKEREYIYNQCIKNNIFVENFIHPNAILAGKNVIGKGSIIFPNSYIGYKTVIGNCVIIQASCSIDHHSLIEDFCHINPNVCTGGGVLVKSKTLISISATISNRVSIGSNVIIGAKSLVLKDVRDNVVAYGSPIKIIRKNILKDL